MGNTCRATGLEGYCEAHHIPVEKCWTTLPPQDNELDSNFIVQFRELKKLRNNRHMDEPEFDEKVEQLAADTYAHRTKDGYCCACPADIAFIETDREHHTTIKSLQARKKEAIWWHMAQGVGATHKESLRNRIAAIDKELEAMK